MAVALTQYFQWLQLICQVWAEDHSHSTRDTLWDPPNKVINKMNKHQLEGSFTIIIIISSSSSSNSSSSSTIITIKMFADNSILT